MFAHLPTPGVLKAHAQVGQHQVVAHVGSSPRVILRRVALRRIRASLTSLLIQLSQHISLFEVLITPRSERLLLGTLLGRSLRHSTLSQPRVTFKPRVATDIILRSKVRIPGSAEPRGTKMAVSAVPRFWRQSTIATMLKRGIYLVPWVPGSLVHFVAPYHHRLRRHRPRLRLCPCLH